MALRLCEQQIKTDVGKPQLANPYRKMAQLAQLSSFVTQVITCYMRQQMSTYKDRGAR
jgi:hypothetical protein